jgi:hypothetical protein
VTNVFEGTYRAHPKRQPHVHVRFVRVFRIQVLSALNFIGGRELASRKMTVVTFSFAIVSLDPCFMVCMMNVYLMRSIAMNAECFSRYTNSSTRWLQTNASNLVSLSLTSEASLQLLETVYHVFIQVPHKARAVYAAARCACRPPRVGARTAPGLLSVYLAKALASAFLALTFCEPTKESTATPMARSISIDAQ